MPKPKFDDDARTKLLKGVDTLAKAVGTTLGPRGRNVAIDRGHDVLVCHDGVSVAKALSLSDPYENIGLRIVREAAQKQVDEVGDGTTVTTILAHALIQEALKLTQAGVNPMSLRAGLEQGAEQLLKRLDELATPITTLQDKVKVATISAEDPELGKLIGETLHHIGTDGVITVEESKGRETIVEHQEGMQFDRGYLSPYFITDPERMESTIENPVILVTDLELSSIMAFKPFWEAVAQDAGRNFVVISPDVGSSILTAFVATKLQGGMNLLAIEPASIGAAYDQAFLEDLATLTGGVFVTKAKGYMHWKDVPLQVLGRAERVTSTKDATLIVGGKGDPKAIEERVQSIRTQLEQEEDSFPQEKLKERIAKLTGGVAVIRVGGATEVEMKERKERALDAVAATKAAILEGIVPGGEVALLFVSYTYDATDEAARLLRQALRKPFRQLVENAGYDPGETLSDMRNQELGYGFDVIDGQFKDFTKAGIVDPVLVVKEAIRNAVSVAIQVMTIDVVIPMSEEKK